MVRGVFLERAPFRASARFRSGTQCLGRSSRPMPCCVTADPAFDGPRGSSRLVIPPIAPSPCTGGAEQPPILQDYWMAARQDRLWSIRPRGSLARHWKERRPHRGVTLSAVSDEMPQVPRSAPSSTRCEPAERAPSDDSALRLTVVDHPAIDRRNAPCSLHVVE